MSYSHFPSSEARALHAAIDDQWSEVDQALIGWTANELRNTAQTLDDLADYLRELAKTKG